jgi:hypothetical protein
MRHFYGHVAGESFRNDDGTSRQAAIQRCEVGELLRLEPEPDNPHDRNAIRVLRGTGEQIGYIERQLAAQLASEDGEYYAAVASVRRPRLSRYYGVGLMIVIARSRDTAANLEDYVRRAFAEEGRVVRRPWIRARGGAPGDSGADVAVIIGTMIVAIVLGVVVGRMVLGF